MIVHKYSCIYVIFILWRGVLNGFFILCSVILGGRGEGGWGRRGGGGGFCRSFRGKNSMLQWRNNISIIYGRINPYPF